MSETYKLGDVIVIDEYQFQVGENRSGYFLDCIGDELSHKIFEKINVDKKKFVKDIIGHIPGDGIFPEVDTLEELGKVIEALQKSFTNIEYNEEIKEDKKIDSFNKALQHLDNGKIIIDVKDGEIEAIDTYEIKKISWWE